MHVHKDAHAHTYIASSYNKGSASSAGNFSVSMKDMKHRARGHEWGMFSMSLRWVIIEGCIL